MSMISNLIIPLIICVIAVYGLYKNVNVFETFIQGATEGLQTVFTIIAPLIGLMTSVGMFKASGALDVLSHALKPLADLISIPIEIIPLAILRPVSGSGALAIYQSILTDFGPDSYIGLIASVMQGSTETTFYTIALYYGAVKITKTRHTLPASLSADIVGFIMSAITVRIFLQ